MLAAGLCLLPVLGGFIVPVGTLLWYAIAQGDPKLGQTFTFMVLIALALQ